MISAPEGEAGYPPLAQLDQVQAELRSALRRLDESGTRPYYDAGADRVAAVTYYEGVRLDRLGVLVAETHREQPRYQPARELYPWIDLQPDGMIRSLYTGHAWNPAELIVEDFRVAELRLRERARLAAAGSAEDAAVEEALERALPFNCEHVVPQSWFGRREPMRGDLHHLFACESRCNSFRGNTPYAEFADFPDQADVPEPAPEAIRADCGKSEHDGFEPARGKGAAARAVFYFWLRYPGPGAEEPRGNRFDALLVWHDRFPVSDWERHRNAAIFERQGNRNPLVDHPEWAAEVVGGMAAATW